MRLFLLPFVAVAALCASGAAKIDWLSTGHDYGIIREADGQAECSFGFVNTGSEPLLITGAKANCGCTTPLYPRQPIAPGDTAWLSVAYDPAGRPGRFHKKIFVDTNAEPRRSVLEISGSVIATEETLSSRYRYTLGPARVRDRIVMIGEVAPNESRGNYIEAYNASDDTIRPVVDASSAPHLAVIPRPETVPPGEQFIWSIVLKADKRGLWGPYTESFVVRPDCDALDSLTVEATFNVKEQFGAPSPDDPCIVVDNSRIDLGRIDPTSEEPLKAQVKITNRGKSVLKLRRIWSADSALALGSKANELKKGKSTVLEIEIDRQKLRGREYLDATVEIITNDPERPVMPLRITGEL